MDQLVNRIDDPTFEVLTLCLKNETERRMKAEEECARLRAELKELNMKQEKSISTIPTDIVHKALYIKPCFVNLAAASASTAASASAATTASASAFTLLTITSNH